jgi:hypothetical protein
VPALSVSPIVAALDQAEVPPDAVITAAAGQSGAPLGVLSLVEALSQVPDPRELRGVRHDVLAVLLLAGCAVLTGARAFAAVAEYAHYAGHAVLEALGVGEVVPHESTLCRVLQKVDPQALEEALRRWALAQLDARPPPVGTPRREQRRLLALDSKTLRGAHAPPAGGDGAAGGVAGSRARCAAGWLPRPSSGGARSAPRRWTRFAATPLRWPTSCPPRPACSTPSTCATRPRRA